MRHDLLVRLILAGGSTLVCRYAPAQTLTVVSAATFRPGPLAPEMIAAGFSPALTASTYSVTVRDAAGSERMASVIGSAAGLVTFVIPDGVAAGMAAITVRSGTNAVSAGPASIAAVSPGLFTANASGHGAPAGVALTVSADGSRTSGDLFTPALLPRPFRLSGEGRQVFLVLFGTGIRGWRSAVTAQLGGISVPVQGAVAQGQFAGLDQVNVGPLPSRIEDQRGELELTLMVDGVETNPVTVAVNSPDLNEWSTRAGLIDANSELAVGEVAGRIYVLGGYPASRQTQATVQVYDPVTDTWELTTPMPVPLNHNMSATVKGKLYMIGGQLTDAGAGNFSDRVFEYDPDTKQWRERARMPTARGAGVAVVVDDRIYVAGSRPPRGADFAVYDPAADTWRVLPDLPTQRNHLAGAAVGGKVYIVGGRFEAGFQSPQTDAVEIYDPRTNAWSRGAAMPKPRGGVNGLAAHGCIHIFGGEGNAGGPNSLYPDHDVYNPVTNTWTALDPMPIPVHGVTGAVFLNGLIYLPGGGTSQGGNSGSRHHQVYRPEMVCR